MSSPTTPSPHDGYQSPLETRNASAEMRFNFSDQRKFTTWRALWIALAECERELGLAISAEQVAELKAHAEDLNLEVAQRYEKELRHDVMAHVHAWGDRCPKAKGIIHLGMTSQDVVCNADLLCIRDAWTLLQKKIARAMISLGDAARRYQNIPTLGFTHYQPAQPVTVGRRIAGWIGDLYGAGTDNHLNVHRFRGLRGATGTQASFLSLAGGDSELVHRLEDAFLHRLLDCKSPNCDEPDHACEDAPAKNARCDYVEMLTFKLTGQTYPRSHDCAVLSTLATVASVLHKIATDIRLLSNRKELDEPFEDKQIGSSAMPYKRNPMRCERICGLTRFVMNLVGNAYDTAATQWLERTLDDSSNRRLSLPEAFLALDGALDLMHNVASGLIVHEAMVRKNLMAELPFLATENILMACVKLGGDRQQYHEKIRVHAQRAGMRVKQEGLDNDLLERLKADKAFWGRARSFEDSRGSGRPDAHSPASSSSYAE